MTSPRKKKLVLDALKPLKEFGKPERSYTERHLKKVMKRNRRNPSESLRNICSIMGYLVETESNKERKKLILEAAWMGMRMSRKLGLFYNLTEEEKIEPNDHKG